MARCSYCGGEGATKEHVGAVVFYVCGASECEREFDEESREAAEQDRDERDR